MIQRRINNKNKLGRPIYWCSNSPPYNLYPEREEAHTHLKRMHLHSLIIIIKNIYQKTKVK